MSIPHPTKFIRIITVIDPDSGDKVVVEIRKDTVTGAMVGLDGSWLEQADNNPCDPYNEGETLEISDNEEGGNARATRSHEPAPTGRSNP